MSTDQVVTVAPMPASPGVPIQMSNDPTLQQRGLSYMSFESLAFNTDTNTMSKRSSADLVSLIVSFPRSFSYA